MSYTLVTDALRTIINELFDGAPPGMSWLLTPGDAGLLTQLRALDAGQASASGGNGRPSIAAHIHHLRYHLELLNRWAKGEPSFETADWSSSWRVQRVDAGQWRALVDELERRASQWRDDLAVEREWDMVTMTGAIGSVAHIAYHMGAVRQLTSQLTSGAGADVDAHAGVGAR